MKECKRCKEVKPLNEFPSDKVRKDGLHAYCRSCKSKEQRDREHAKTDRKHADLVWKCHRCKNAKPKNLFQPRKTRNSQYLCKECKHKTILKTREKSRSDGKRNYADPIKRAKIKKRHKELRDTLKLKWINELGGKCNDCSLNPSTNVPVACFDFHHFDETKEFNLSKLIHAPKKNAKIIDDELLKCIVLCSNCHRKHHHFECIIKYEKEILGEGT